MKPLSVTRVIARAIELNDTQRRALASVADGHPAGANSTFRALRNRGLIEDKRGVHFRGRYTLTAAGLQIFRALPNG